MRRIIFILLTHCLALTATLHAQTVLLSGKITITDGTPAPGANIVLLDANKNISGIYKTNELGIYSLSINPKEDKEVSVSFLGYRKITISSDSLHISADRKSRLDLVLKEDAVLLNEIVIMDENLEKDTIKLKLGTLHLKENDALEDILKKIPNFRISEDGSILYKGKNIDKILVNKQGAFVNQNSIALKNIEKKIIDDIDIINNYQNSFNLDFDQRNETVLNINTKENYQHIFLNTLSIGYGVKDKYDAQGKSFYFSKGINAFLISNTNNTGSATVQEREISNIFSVVQPFSSYQKSALTNLFIRDENRTSDFLSTNNFTVRKEGERSRFSSSVYYFNVNNQNNTSSNSFSETGKNLQNKKSEFKYQGNNILSIVEYDQRIGRNNILHYFLSGNMLRNTSNVSQLNITSPDDQENNLLAIQQSNIFSIFNKLGMSSKIHKKLILDNEISYYHESTDQPDNSISNLSKGAGIISQILGYKSNIFGGKSALKYKYNDALMPSLCFQLKSNTEEIKFRPAPSVGQLNRTGNDLSVSLQFAGNNLYKKFSYLAAVSYQYLTNNSSNISKQRSFIPVKLELDYENRSDHVNLQYSRKMTTGDIDAGILSIRSFDQIVMGAIPLALNIVTSNELAFSYAYNNFFKGISYDASLSYASYAEQIKQGLVSIDENGIQLYKLYLIPLSSTYRFAGNASRILFKYHFPAKASIGLNHTITNAPGVYDNAITPVNNKQTQLILNCQTLTGHSINFENTLNLTYSRLNIASAPFSSNYLSNTTAIKFSRKRTDIKLSFIYQHNQVLRQHYIRKNCHLIANYNMEKITLGIEARNIDDLFGLFNNKAYNTVLSFDNGITNIRVKNTALHYAILIIKYKF
ncbi:carboxypeptidase-like regulatory domain-containing protein [Chitinophaga pendula]|uniref:carboxypeptidase-like regulatory domain-containing protein n=1 Tax=Chitinophaga TaxID=79328 RepID=UPI000BAF81A5|nr:MULTISPECIES: carboxypeptidase-like regulatory domain-containing protein [Chitinophaga]ASZ12980.1 hypothetical protein CK934_19455 [Chitinophaga sp. MD30]UCJ09388.1 carboxypeptidase-like regulatory domain-containing protein [Chitinophaga pendula]